MVYVSAKDAFVCTYIIFSFTAIINRNPEIKGYIFFKKYCRYFTCFYTYLGPYKGQLHKFSCSSLPHPCFLLVIPDEIYHQVMVNSMPPDPHCLVTTCRDDFSGASAADEFLNATP